MLSTRMMIGRWHLENDFQYRLVTNTNTEGKELPPEGTVSLEKGLKGLAAVSPN